MKMVNEAGMVPCANCPWLHEDIGIFLSHRRYFSYGLILNDSDHLLYGTGANNETQCKVVSSGMTMKTLLHKPDDIKKFRIKCTELTFNQIYFKNYKYTPNRPHLVDLKRGPDFFLHENLNEVEGNHENSKDTGI